MPEGYGKNSFNKTRFLMTEVKSVQPRFCPHCNGTREQCGANEYCQYRWPKSTQPQLPPLDTTDGDIREGRRIEGLSEGVSLTTAAALRAQIECRERQLLAALAENESLKAKLEESSEVIKGNYILYSHEGVMYY